MVSSRNKIFIAPLKMLLAGILIIYIVIPPISQKLSCEYNAGVHIKKTPEEWVIENKKLLQASVDREKLVEVIKNKPYDFEIRHPEYLSIDFVRKDQGLYRYGLIKREFSYVDYITQETLYQEIDYGWGSWNHFEVGSGWLKSRVPYPGSTSCNKDKMAERAQMMTNYINKIKVLMSCENNKINYQEQ